MSSQRILVVTAGRGSCSQLPCAHLQGVLCRLFPGVTIDTHDLESNANLEPKGCPKLVLLQSNDPPKLSCHMRNLRHAFPQAPFLGVLCSVGEERDIPISLLEQLDDHLCCPFREVDVSLRMRRFLKETRTGACETQATDFRKDGYFAGLQGDSPRFRQALEKVPMIAESDCTCLIEGATGTGKELFARAIHYLSPRRSKAFVPVNCGALPDQLIENELFGHVRGAYTGAASPEAGLFAFADDGTLFLDEVDALSMAAQVKLLRVLQENEYRPVGSPRMQKSRARILAATNANLRARIESKQFREDLYHRLNVLRLSIPTLGERSDDIPGLAHYFLQLYAERHRRPVRDISPGALQTLISYAWPGNVRELESVIQRALLLCTGHRLLASDLDILEAPSGEKMQNATDEYSVSLRSAKALAVERFERAYLASLMASHHGNVSRAAKAAGKERRSFQRLLRKYQIDSDFYREGREA